MYNNEQPKLKMLYVDINYIIWYYINVSNMTVKDIIFFNHVHVQVISAWIRKPLCEISVLNIFIFEKYEWFQNETCLIVQQIFTLLFQNEIITCIHDICKIEGNILTPFPR